MKKELQLFALSSMLALVGCADGNIKQDNAMTQIMMQKETAIDNQYQDKLSQQDGRIKGLEEALIKGLTDSLRSAEVNREIANEALSLAKENSSALKKLASDLADLEAKAKKSASASKSSPAPAKEKDKGTEASFSESPASADKGGVDDSGFKKIE